LAIRDEGILMDVTCVLKGFLSQSPHIRLPSANASVLADCSELEQGFLLLLSWIMMPIRLDPTDSFVLEHPNLT
jgi:hypothetical protein